MNPPRIPSQALEGLMKKAFQDQAIDVGLFWDALLNSHLILPMAPNAEAETQEGDDDDGEKQIPIILGQDPEGNHLVWIFTSEAAMTEYTEQNLKYLVMPAVDLFQSVKDSPHEVVLIGPGSLTINLHPQLMATLAEGKVPELPAQEMRSIPKNTTVSVGRPVDDPSALEAVFKPLFENLSDVVEACFIQVEDDQSSRLLLGLRLTDQSQENFKRVAALVARAAEGVLEKGKTMDITLMDKSLKGAFEKWGVSFFKRIG